jgi:hypothetical protein
MTIVYKIFNPQTGEYLNALDKADCTAKIVELAWQHYLAYTHGSPYSICEIDAVGNQVWRNPQGEEILSPEELLRLAELSVSKALTSIPATPIAEMP